jgi:hypothetical protein
MSDDANEIAAQIKSLINAKSNDFSSNRDGIIREQNQMTKLFNNWMWGIFGFVIVMMIFAIVWEVKGMNKPPEVVQASNPTSDFIKGLIGFFALGVFIWILMTVLNMTGVTKRWNRSMNTVVNRPIHPQNVALTLLPGSESLPSTANVRRFTHNFWIYIDDPAANMDKYRSVFIKTDNISSNQLQNSKIIAYFAKNSGNLTIKLRTSFGDSNVADFSTITTPDDMVKGVTFHADNKYFKTVEVSGLGAKSWNMITLDIDGSAITVSVNGSIVAAKDESKEYQLAVLSGQIMIGNINANFPAFTGYLAKFLIDISGFKSESELIKEYNNGPFSNTILAKMGLPRYEIRRIDQDFSLYK